MALGDARLLGSKVNTVIAITMETIFITAVIHGQGETLNNMFPIREPQKTSYAGSAAVSIVALQFAYSMYSLEFHIFGVLNPKDIFHKVS